MKPPTAFEIDSLKERGRVLKGEMAHYCMDWDGMTVDETTPAEMWCCTCFDKSTVSEKARQNLAKNKQEFDDEMETDLERLRARDSKGS